MRSLSRRLCLVLLSLLLLLLFFVFQPLTGNKAEDRQAKELHKKGFLQTQAVAKELIETKGVTVEQIVTRLEAVIYECFLVLSCEQDKTLLQHHPIQDRLFIASNLINCDKTMPNFILQLLKFITLYDEDQIRVSIYEGGSTDMTPLWLVLLQTILTKINVTNSITVHGNLVRDANEDRIEFLAKIRNEAIAPMIQWSRDDSTPWKAQKVVFINDVYFCAQHILRLLLHKDEDVVCGMDFSLWMGSLPRSIQRPFMVHDLSTRFFLPRKLVHLLSKVKRILRMWRRSLSYKDFLRLKIPLAFYDRWVTVDLNGLLFEQAPPYVLDPSSKEYIHQGHPIYVHSCWNGMAILKATPLLQGKHSSCTNSNNVICLDLKFRSCYEEECQASECFFICHDYTQLGYDRIMIDPGVRFAYTYEESAFLYDANRVPELPFVPWDDYGVRNRNTQFKRHPTNITCCELTNGDMTQFDKDCHLFDYSNLNCTLRAMGISNSCVRASSWIGNPRFKTLSNRLFIFLAAIGLFQFLISMTTVHEVLYRTRTVEESPVSRTTPEEILELLRGGDWVSSSPPSTHNTSSTNELLIRSIANRQFAMYWNQSGVEIGLKLRTAFEEYSLLPCVLDADLLESGFHSMNSLFFASVIRDVEESMPNLIVQISRLILRMPHRSLFVSIYESGSRDSTARWLVVLRRVLELVSVPHKIIINGSILKRNSESRTEFIAKLRSIAMQPLRNAYLVKKKFHHVAFVDGVFFCAQHLARLNTLSADIACGMNFDRLMKRKDKKTSIDGIQLIFKGAASSIDISGKRFHKRAPFLRNLYSRVLLRNGQPIPVHACWNGLVLLKVEPFYQGVRFRTLPAGSCPSSETIQLCEDFIKGGFSRIAIDPGVRVSARFLDVIISHHPRALDTLPFIQSSKLTNTTQFLRHPSTVDCCQQVEDSKSSFKSSCRTYTFHQRINQSSKLSAS
eukprot:g7654.t1